MLISISSYWFSLGKQLHLYCLIGILPEVKDEKIGDFSCCKYFCIPNPNKKCLYKVFFVFFLYFLKILLMLGCFFGYMRFFPLLFLVFIVIYTPYSSFPKQREDNIWLFGVDEETEWNSGS